MLFVLIQLVHHKIISRRAYRCRTTAHLADMIIDHFLHRFFIWKIPREFWHSISQKPSYFIKGFQFTFIFSSLLHELFVLYSFFLTKLLAFLFKLGQNRREGTENPLLIQEGCILINRRKACSQLSSFFIQSFNSLTNLIILFSSFLVLCQFIQLCRIKRD